MKNKKMPHCWKSSKIQLKIVERGKIDISNTHIQDGLFFLFGRGTRAKGGGVNYSN